MKPIDQTIFGGEQGNCLAAAIASIFEVELDAIPNFCAQSDRWMTLCSSWFRDRGFAAVRLMLEGDLASASKYLDEWLPDAFTIVSGKAKRGHLHATVWRGGTMVHDPHPSRAGLLDVLDVIIFAPNQPIFTAKISDGESVHEMTNDKKLYAFWRYHDGNMNTYLHGEVEGVADDGRVTVKGYDGFQFDPARILPLVPGRKLGLSITKIQRETGGAIIRAREAGEQRTRDLLNGQE